MDRPVGYALQPQPLSVRFVLVVCLDRAFRRWYLAHTFPSRLPDPRHLTVLACPVVVRAASTFPDVPRVRLSSASATACCDRPTAVVSHHHKVQERLAALDVRHPQPVPRIGPEPALHTVRGRPVAAIGARGADAPVPTDPGCGQLRMHPRHSVGASRSLVDPPDRPANSSSRRLRLRHASPRWGTRRAPGTGCPTRCSAWLPFTSSKTFPDNRPTDTVSRTNQAAASLLGSHAFPEASGSPSKPTERQASCTLSVPAWPTDSSKQASFRGDREQTKRTPCPAR